MSKKILLINPWIHDFAAYDFWLKPLGLLYLGGLLRANQPPRFILSIVLILTPRHAAKERQNAASAMLTATADFSVR